jgi:hypothetical protein
VLHGSGVRLFIEVICREAAALDEHAASFA